MLLDLFEWHYLFWGKNDLGIMKFRKFALNYDFVKICPGELVYNPALGVCDYQSNVLEC